MIKIESLVPFKKNSTSLSSSAFRFNFNKIGNASDSHNFFKNPFVSDKLCKTNCNHGFCKNCLDSWFDKNKLSCPMCRGDIKYFNHRGVNNRVVSVYRPRRRPQPNPVTATSIIITKKSFIITNISLACSVITNCIMFGLWGGHKGYF